MDRFEWWVLWGLVVLGISWVRGGFAFGLLFDSNFCAFAWLVGFGF